MSSASASQNGLALFQPALYRASDYWHDSMRDAAAACAAPLTWDAAAIMSVACFGHTCGTRTLLNEVKRQPWLSQVDQRQEPVLSEIPSHGLQWLEPNAIAARLERLLLEEAETACGDHRDIYVLLSGGLDSRVVAGVAARLYSEGRLRSKPIAVCWGTDKSRDVVYSKAVATLLGFEWIHVPLSAETVRDNIELAAGELGGMVSPIHLHAMSWFRQVDPDSVVLSGSYGDSIGRAEFSRRHLLELRPLAPHNALGLVDDRMAGGARELVLGDLTDLRRRSGNCSHYALCEHEMQGEYMRGMLAHTMDIVNRYCCLHHMFTAEAVFSFMWSLHPACRDDRPYAALLRSLHPGLVQIPWARTNKAMVGPTVGKQSGLDLSFHKYHEWIQGPLADELVERLDPKWFEETGVFDAAQVSIVRNSVVRPADSRFVSAGRVSELVLWLACLRRFAEIVGVTGGGRIVECDDVRPAEGDRFMVTRKTDGYLRRVLRSSKTVYAVTRRLRLPLLKRRSLRMYPPANSDGLNESRTA